MYKLVYIKHLGSLPYFCTKNETMAPLHMATLTVQRELPRHKYLGSLPYFYTRNITMPPIHVATLTDPISRYQE